MTLHAGACLCGKVRYEARGEVLFSVICHCRDCQRASGSFGVPVMGVRKSSFTVSGATKVTTSVGGSGQAALRHFCASCGSLLFGTPAVAPDLITLYVGSLDRLDAFEPTAAIFTRSRPAWAKPAHGLVEFDGPPQ
ncbi:MAG: GFA family protein [Gammaproteobacteria bacterium]|nr:GFA family protein [Gammaproteobacteria bacterium]